jgi:carbonic anhydrase
MAEISDKLERQRKDDAKLLVKMQVAAQGQEPRFFIVSQIHRSTQDLKLLGLEQGDAFHGTRVSDCPLLSPSRSPVLFAGPAAYNGNFPQKDGVVITFDRDEPPERISESLVNLTEHPDLSEIPIIALSVDYDQGHAQAIGHSFHRNRAIEKMFVSRCAKPERLDESVLVLLCSDSRVHPPSTPIGIPYAIQTLGAYVSKYSGADDETTQLNDFFSDWLSTDANEKRILIVEHGGFTREEPPCGAGQASLNPQQVKGEFLRPVIELLNREALRFEDGISKTVEERVLAIGQATEYNLRNYPAIAKVQEDGVSMESLFQIVTMDTVTGKLREIG